VIFLDKLADSVNPLLAIAAIVATIFEWRRSRHAAMTFAATALLGLAGVYAVQAIDAHFGIWRRWGGDYSTHAAFATCIVLAMALRFPRRRALLAAVLLAYFALMLFMRYHTAADIVSAAAVACAVTLPWHFSWPSPSASRTPDRP
jgi:hypothetical protein